MNQKILFSLSLSLLSLLPACKQRTTTNQTQEQTPQERVKIGLLVDTSTNPTQKRAPQERVKIRMLVDTPANRTQEPAAPVFANETDYICGMKVQADWTDTCHYKGKVYAFCATSCKEEFEAAPESFLKKRKNAAKH